MEFSKLKLELSKLRLSDKINFITIDLIAK